MNRGPWIALAVVAVAATASIALHRALPEPPSTGAPFAEVPGPDDACKPADLAAPAPMFGIDPMIPICADVYVEPGVSMDDMNRLRMFYSRGARRVARALGPIRAEPPVVIFCSTAPCQIFFTGPTRRSFSLAPGETRRDSHFTAGDRHTLLINDIDEKAEYVAAHELTHVEFRARRQGQTMPAWFSEGTAQWVSQEPKCAEAMPDGVEFLQSLDSNRVWNDYTDDRKRGDRTYCQAQREVTAWVERHEDGALAMLLEAVADGDAFEDVYGPMMTE